MHGQDVSDTLTDSLRASNNRGMLHIAHTAMLQLLLQAVGVTDEEYKAMVVTIVLAITDRTIADYEASMESMKPIRDLVGGHEENYKEHIQKEAAEFGIVLLEARESGFSLALVREAMENLNKAGGGVEDAIALIKQRAAWTPE